MCPIRYLPYEDLVMYEIEAENGMPVQVMLDHLEETSPRL